MATHDDRSAGAGGYSDDGFYLSSGSGGGVHHFDDGTQSFDSTTKSFDNTGYTPVDPVASHYEDEDDRRRVFGWNGGTDLGLFVLRVGLGAAFVVHGLQKVFAMFGGPGIDGFAKFLETSGFREAKILSWVTGITELGGGALLILGLFTPLAAAGILGVMANAIVVKWGGGFFGAPGVEQESSFAVMAFALLFTGPGRAALDYGRSWFRRPLLSGTIFLFIAAAAVAATLYVFRSV
ncbi:DoxX family protein [Umezawaea sp. NPDC059074]|uniref:DoxX family protein n=1 Tax=Umezawaea sp. NPDC059074 TaxID=3346716 RepID=UPI0036CF9DFE